MDIPPDGSRLDWIRKVLMSISWHSVLGFVESLFSFFNLTKEDQLKAGIFVGGEGRDIKND
jgi:hypothetical protein